MTAFWGHIYLLVAQVIYAFNYSMVKEAMPDYIGPFEMVLLRIGGAAILFLLLEFLLVKQCVKYDKKILKQLFILSLPGVVINQVFFIWGLSHTTPINSAIIMVSNPVLVFLFSTALVKGWAQWAGLASCVIGAMSLISFRGDFSFGSDTWAGDVMTLVNSSSWALFIVKSRKLFQSHHPVWVMKWLFVFGFMIYAPFTFYQTLHVNYAAFTPMAWFALFFVVVMTTFFAYLFNLYGLKIHTPETVSAYIYLQPLLAGIIAVAMGKDHLTPVKIMSGILIILGLYLINLKLKAK
ncbi:MAG: DMT family transporter [Bacteroidia bacterium]|nr:DMT family transporter [Bacteroidia bacterium]